MINRIKIAFAALLIAGSANAQGGAPPYVGTANDNPITITAAMTWQPLAAAGLCQIYCAVINSSTDIFYICPAALTGTPTSQQIQKCANQQLNPGDQVILYPTTNAYSITSASVTGAQGGFVYVQ